MHKTTILCIDNYQNSILKGRLYSADSEYSDTFQSTIEFLKKMSFLTDQTLPQAFQQYRTFHPLQELEVHLPSDTAPHTGTIATFALHILFQQNASWQGNIRWLEGGQEAHFRSVLELIFLMDSTLSEHTKTLSTSTSDDTPDTKDAEMESDDGEQFILSQSVINDFLNASGKKNLGDSSVRTYRSALQMLYDFLPPSKLVDKTTADRWKTFMEKQGLTSQTIHSRLYILNTFLRYLDKASWVSERVSVTPASQEQSQLSPEEYQLLLETAQAIGKHRAALLMKTIVTAGCRPQELHQLTVDALHSGSVTVTSYGSPRQLIIPEPLRQELLTYTAHQKIRSGAVFVTKDGNPLHHTVIWKEIKAVCRHAGISEKKGNPSAFYRLYQEINKT